MTKRTKIFVALFGALLLLGGFGIRGASAHATPTSYEPEAASLLPNVPPAVRIHFSEHIEPNASVITIFAPDGSNANSGASSVDPSDQSTYRAGVQDRGQGTYTVSWAVVSADDGHFTKGAFSFSVGKETGNAGAASGIQIQHLTSIPEAVTIWLELLGQAILIGTLTLFLLLWPVWKTRFPQFSSHLETFERRLTAIIAAGLLLIFAGGISFLILKTFDLEQLQSTAFTQTFHTFIQTENGAYTIYRLILALVFGIFFFIFRKKILASTIRSWPSLVLYTLIALIIFARTKVSHAAAAHFHPDFAIFIHSIHLFFKEMWVGAPLIFLVMFFPLFSRTKNSALLTSALSKLSSVVSIAFGVVGVTGAYIVWLDLKSPANLLSTEWGSRFIILFLFSGAWLLVRLYHQILVDRAAYASARAMGTKKSERLVAWAPYSFVLEFLVGVSVLLITSYLIITTPPYASNQFQFIERADSQGEHLSLQIHPSEPKEFLVTVTNAENLPDTAITNLIVTLTNEEKSIGPITAPVEKRFPGGYVFPANLLSPTGTWRVNITAERPGAYDAVGSFTFSYPNDVEATRVNPDNRSLGSFELFLIVNGLLIAGFSFFIWRGSRNLNISGSAMGGGAFERNIIRPWAGYPVPVLGLFAIIGIISFSYNNFLITDFQKLCEKNGNFWLQSIPMRDGVALSSDTVTGCTLNVGLNHFADMREYQYFLRTATTAPEITLTPLNPIAGKPTTIDLGLYNVENGRKEGPITELSIEHERVVHVIIIGEDLKTFAHIHPEDFEQITPEVKKSGQFHLEYTFPKAGRYTIAVNYYVRAQQFVTQFMVDVSGETKMDPRSEDLSRKKSFDGYDVSLDAPSMIFPGEQTTFTYHIQKNGQPVTDMQPYLAAAMHVAVIDQDLQGFIHAHGGPALPGSAAVQAFFQRNLVNFHNHFVPDKFGPDIQARITFPRPGLYEVFGEFKRGSDHVITSFMVKVEKP